MRALVRSTLILVSILAVDAAWSQSRFDVGVYAGYAGGNPDLTKPFSNLYGFGRVSGKPQGWTMGGDLTYWIRPNIGVRLNLELDDPQFNTSDSSNDLVVTPVTVSAVVRKRRVYGGGGVGWYFAEFQEQAEYTLSPGTYCANGPCSNPNPTTTQSGSNVGFQGFAGVTAWRKLFIETKYSYAKVSSWGGGAVGQAIGKAGPLNVGTITLVVGWRF